MARSTNHERSSNVGKADEVIDLTGDEDDAVARSLTASPLPSSNASNKTTDSEIIDLDDLLFPKINVVHDRVKNSTYEVIEEEDEDEDEDLRRAIELSLQEHKGVPPSQGQSQRKGKARARSVDDVEGRDAMSELLFIKALSAQSFPINIQHSHMPLETAIQDPVPDTATDGNIEWVKRESEIRGPLNASTSEMSRPVDDTGSTNFLGLDRARMEAERLARLKRKREEVDEDNTENDSSGSKKSSRCDRQISPPVLQRKETRKCVTSTLHTAEQTNSAPSRGDGPLRNPQVPCPDGVVLQTYVDGFPSARTTTFASLIAPKTGLRSCILSSFIWDFDWLFQHFDTNATKFLLVMHAKTPMERNMYVRDFEGIKSIRLCFPPMDGVAACMHSKLMVLFYDDRARIVIPSANLVGFDWGVGGVMENTLWYIDLPVKKSMSKNAKLDITSAAAEAETMFKESLMKFLQLQTIPEDAVRKLNEYDFSRTKNIGFVFSAAGTHHGNDWRNIGLCGLGRTVSSLGLAQTQPISVDFVASSIGSLNSAFMRSMYLACQGDDGLTEYTLRTATSLPARRLEPDARDRKTNTVYKHTGDDWNTNFRLYYPSQSTVARSKGGGASAGTICFSQKWWEGVKFPRSNMKDCVSVREGLLMHNKIIFVKFARPTGNLGRLFNGWTYVGSGNLSESAWGRLVQDKATKTPKLNCRNWECGIVIPITIPTGTEYTSQADVLFQVFNETVAVPMKTRAASSYQDAKTIPWFSGGG